MKKRWLIVLIAAAMTLLLVFPAGSLAAGGEAQGEVLLEGEETSAEATPTEAPTASEEQTPTITLDKHSITVYVGDTFTLNPVITPAGHSVCWHEDYISGGVSSTEEGTFYAWGWGTVILTATVAGYPDVFDTCEVTIKKRLVTSVDIPQSSYTINIGESVDIEATVLPANATSRYIDWAVPIYETIVEVTYLDQNNHTKARFTGVHAGKQTIKVYTPENIDIYDTFTITVIDPSVTPMPSFNSPSATPRPPSSAAATPTPTLTKAMDESGIPSATRVPVELEATDWAGAEQAAGDLAAGSLGSIEAPDGTIVPVSLLEMLKQNQSALEIDCGGYFCIIDGAMLTGLPDGLDAIDIGMTMEKDATLSAAWGCSAYKLRFNYHGELPGTFTFRVKAEGSSPGDTIYLYYFDDAAGEFEGIHTAVVDDEGYVSLNITHCSSYYITDAIIEGAVNNFVVPAATDTVQRDGLAAFLSNRNVVFWLSVYFLGVGIVVLLVVLIRRAIKRSGKGDAPVRQPYMK